MWIARCNARHGTTTDDKLSAQAEKIRREVMHLYKLRTQVELEDRAIFRDDLTTHLEEPADDLNDWINHHKDLIHLSVNRAKKNDTKNVPKIYTLLPREPGNVGRPWRKRNQKKKRKRTTHQNTQHTTPSSSHHYNQSRLEPYIAYSKETNNKTVTQNQEVNAPRRKKQKQSSLRNYFPDHPT